jgi:hypothetical protein
MGVDSCTVRSGTWLFVTGSSAECSTFEDNGTTEAELRACAEGADPAPGPAVTLDGKALTLTAAETPLLHIVLPADNLFGAPAGSTGLSVGHGWVALVHPLPPGTHTVVISGNPVITTKIVVQPGR